VGDTILKKDYQDYTCVEGAKQRIKYLYDSYDKVIVNFSGGKDSTAMLYITIEVAREIGKLPVECTYIDHEAEGLGTIKLLEEIHAMPEVDLHWYAVPFSLRNAGSMHAPMWYPFHPDEKHLWVRQKPAYAITEIEGHVWETDPNYEHPDGLPFRANAVKKSLEVGEMLDLHRDNYIKKGLTAINLVGIRAQESMARYWIMTRKKNECYLSSADSIAYPIYDFMAHDVWKYIRETGLPYNTEYDTMNRGVNYNKLGKQRIGSIFGEESLRALDHWCEYYGDYWHKLLERAEGIKTAWRYCNDGMYTGTKIEKEEGVKWSEYTIAVLNNMSPQTRKLVKKSMNKIVTWHKNQTDYPIAESEKESCPLTGISWEFLARIAIRGDTKERNLQKVTILSQKAREREGLTRDEAVNRFGKPEYIERYYEKKKAK
jgi:predicted phosphoadenosine phosphosulfate sulfurtransferase